MKNRKARLKINAFKIVCILLTIPFLSFSQYLNQVNETSFQSEYTSAYNYDGTYLTSINTMSDSNRVQNGWNTIQFKQYDHGFNIIKETRFQDSLHIFNQGYSVEHFDNAYYFTGSQQGLFSTGPFQGIVCKFDNSGNLLWLKNYFPTVYDSKISIIRIINDRIYISGSHEDEITSAQSVFISELDRDGNILWTKTFGNFTFVKVTNIRSTSDRILLSYQYSTAGNNRKAMLYWLDFNGNIKWQKTYGNTGPWLMSALDPYELPDGYILLYGFRTNPIIDMFIDSWMVLTGKFGNILKDTVFAFSEKNDAFIVGVSPPLFRNNDFLILGHDNQAQGEPTNAFLACIDYDFNVKWKYDLGVRKFNNYLTFIKDIGNGYYLLCGHVYKDNNHPTSDEWFVIVNLGLDEEESETSEFGVYPNPSSGKITFSLGFTPNTSLDIVITDIQGRTVKTLVVNQKEIQIDLELSANGVYLVHLVENGKIQSTKKLIYAK